MRNMAIVAAIIANSQTPVVAIHCGSSTPLGAGKPYNSANAISSFKLSAISFALSPVI